MARDSYKPLIRLVQQAFSLARSLGIPNLFQPGLAREIIIADILGHEVIPAKRQPDARDPDNPNIMFEYLSCKEGGSGQFDRMFKSPIEKRERSLHRIRRNSKIYLAVFYADNQLQVKEIYELDPIAVEEEAVRQLERSTNQISHVGLSISWATERGRVIYRDEQSPQHTSQSLHP